MNTNERRQLESLLSSLCDGEINTEQQAQLEAMLRSSSECRVFYLQYVDMHARLSMHPNLTTGIPLTDPAPVGAQVDETSAVAEAGQSQHDELVLARAQLALDVLSETTASVRRKQAFNVRWIALAVAALFAVGSWALYENWPDHSRHPVLRRVIGSVTIESASSSALAEIGHRLVPGQRLQTGDDDAQAVLEYDDGTRVVVCFESGVAVPEPASGVHLQLLSGTMEVDAAPQKPGNPLIFATDHARYVVLGTRFRLYRETEASRLELGEGKVRLERQVDGKTVDVSAGFVAVATAEDTPLDVQPLPAAQGELLATLPKAGQAVAFNDSGSLLATGDWNQGFKTWTPGESTPRNIYDGKIGRSSGLVFIDQTLVQVGRERAPDTLIYWRPGDADAVTFPLAGSDARSRAIAADASCTAESDNDGTHIYSLDVSARSVKPLLELPGKGKAWCLALSHNAMFAAAGFWDGTVRVYDITQIGNADSPADSVVFEKRLAHTPTQAALSADGTQLAIFSRKDGLLLFDLASGQRQLVWAAGAAAVTCVKFTPDGQHLVAGLSDGTARMWRTNGIPLLVIDAGHVPRDVAWSPEASLLATAAGKVHLWKCELP